MLRDTDWQIVGIDNHNYVVFSRPGPNGEPILAREELSGLLHDTSMTRERADKKFGRYEESRDIGEWGPFGD